MAQIIDLSTLAFSYGTHNLKVLAKAQGYQDSNFSNIVKYDYQPQISAQDGVLKCLKINDDVTSISVYKAGGEFVKTVDYDHSTAEKPFLISLVDAEIEQQDMVYIVCNGDGVNENKSNSVNPFAPGVDFATDSPEIVAQEAQRIADYFEANGTLPDTAYKVGDSRVIELTTGEQVEFIIGDFCHDDLVTPYDSGAKKAGLSLLPKDCLKAKQKWHSSNSNYPATSDMYKKTLPTILSQFPEEWQAVFRPVKKKVAEYGNSSKIIELETTLFLPTYIEIMGTVYYNGTTRNSKDGEGEQYAYYKEAEIPEGFSPATPDAKTGTFKGTGSSYQSRFGSKSTSNGLYYNTRALKGLGYNAASSDVHWTSSPYAGNSTHVCYVGSNGSGNGNSASNSCGVAPCFCI